MPWPPTELPSQVSVGSNLVITHLCINVAFDLFVLAPPLYLIKVGVKYSARVRNVFRALIQLWPPLIVTALQRRRVQKMHDSAYQLDNPDCDWTPSGVVWHAGLH